MISQHRFPKDFLWGASTASHQVEGGTVNQWSVWELEHATDLAAGAEKRLHRLPDWKQIRDRAEDPDNYVSGAAVDHYGRYRQDFDMLQQLQFNSFRFGIEWSRIEPQEGAFNLEEIKHYHDYIDELLSRGVTPVLNLWHWTMPTWFTDKGGFEKKENLRLFDGYVSKVAEEYGDKVKYFITLNEPNNYATLSYVSAIWPPQRKSIRTGLAVYRNLVHAHNRAYTLIKSRNPAAQVGVAQHLTNIQPKRPHNLLDVMVTKVMSYGWDWWFLNRIRRHQDFVGVNYYRTEYYRGFGSLATPHVPVNDLGWYMEPEGLYAVLSKAWVKYKKPLIITENGVADRKDQYRQWWLEQTVVAMQRAMSEGVDLRGYMHWSLLDNFEWADGWWPKFGLIEVDRQADMKRTPRPSAVWFSRFLAEQQGKAKASSRSDRQASPTTPDIAKPAAKPVNGTAIAERPAAPRRATAQAQPVTKPLSKSRLKPAARPSRPQAGSAGQGKGTPDDVSATARRIRLRRFRKIQ